MSLVPFLPDSNSLALRQVLIDGDRLRFLARSNTPTVSCPQCGGISRRVHSRYTRMLADLPWQGRQVRVRLEVRRFFCVTADCLKTTFAERLPRIAAVYGRSTTRLHQALCLIGWALSGQAGARLLVERQPTIDGSQLILYSTAESGPMCQSAILWAGVETVVFGSSIRFLQSRGWWQIDITSEEVIRRSPHRRCTLIGGFLESECNALFETAACLGGEQTQGIQ